MIDFMRRDVIFLHPPSVYDFRKDSIVFGPVSDVVPSSSVFEMYPMGITSLADRLEQEGYHVQVINVAYKMLRDAGYDPEEEIRRNNPKFWAIDLHWLPHVHGALALAEIIKKYHPDIPVIIGGLSASYYHEELIDNPNIDYVIRGDSTEEPLLELIDHIRKNLTLYDVPNITWRDDSGNTVVNPLTCVPYDVNRSDLPAYKYAMRSVFKYWNLSNIVPYLRWMEYPMTALFISRGCTQNCSICGGSRNSYLHICNRQKPAFRSPEKLLQDVRFIKEFSKAPIFIIHDIRMPGLDYAKKLLSIFKKEKIENEMVLELFAPGDKAFFKELQETFPRYSLEMTLESHDEELRKLNGKFPVSNKEIENTIANAIENGCNRLDIYFMVGIPKQTSKSVLDSLDYARYLLENYGEKGQIQIYIAPLAPFLDPGSPAYENPDKYGYKIRAHSLEEHRQLLTNHCWGEILNYESLYMPRRELVKTTYDASAKLIKIKEELGLMSSVEANKTLLMLDQAKDVVNRIEAAGKLPEPERSESYKELFRLCRDINSKRVYEQTDFINWGRKRFQLKPIGVFKLMVELFFETLSLARTRFRNKTYLPTTPPERDSKNSSKTEQAPRNKPLHGRT